MFSFAEKRMIAEEVEKLLLSLKHPEMPSEKPRFRIQVRGAADWSSAEIEPNWFFDDENKARVNPWNERARTILESKKN